MKAPSSGYSTLKREERMESSSWNSSPPPPPVNTRAQEVRQEVYREEKTGEHSYYAVPNSNFVYSRPVDANVTSHESEMDGTIQTSIFEFDSSPSDPQIL